MSKITSNNAAWAQLFEKYDILRRVETDGIFTISAEQIKEYREPRLMVKFDHAMNLPKLFSDNRLAILPVTRGDYVISHFDAYCEFEPDNKPIIRLSMPSHIQSLNINNIPSEAIALNCAAASGIIEDFMEDSGIFATVSGRMSSGDFLFDIDDVQSNSLHSLHVHHAQMEIDAAYEGVSCLALFEAKMDISDDFLIRQLYYPFRAWLERVTKTVKPVFLTYANGIYTLSEYAFEDPMRYNSLKLVKQQRYSIEDTAISASDIQDILGSVTITDEPEIPFPQADNFDRVINLCELASKQKLTRNSVTENYDFDARQTNYYTDAARYLGLLEKNREDGTLLYSLSEKGKRILNLDFKQRQLDYCKSILSHRAFNASLRLYFQKGAMPSNDEIVNIMKKSGLYQVKSENTFLRRASSIRGWVNWIVSLFTDKEEIYVLNQCEGSQYVPVFR